MNPLHSHRALFRLQDSTYPCTCLPVRGTLGPSLHLCPSTELGCPMLVLSLALSVFT